MSDSVDPVEPEDSFDSTSNAASGAPAGNSQTGETTSLYRERQWVPMYWWFLAFFVVALITAQIARNRSMVWLITPAIVFSIVAVWILLWLSSTVIQVEQDAKGTRWLLAGGAILPNNVVSRSTAVPATARRNAMGRQLDPAAFVVSHGWVPEMVMLVLDDPEDPTPYWLISSKNPEKLLQAYVPNQKAGD